jgi:hypothetical protein
MTSFLSKKNLQIDLTCISKVYLATQAMDRSLQFGDFTWNTSGNLKDNEVPYQALNYTHLKNNTKVAT